MKNKRNSEPSYAMQVKYLMNFIRFIHRNPTAGADEIIEGCNISDSTFYRYLRHAHEFDVAIKTVSRENKKCGYQIIDYGFLTKKNYEA